jgi:TP901 family phage tail tape measure protein
VIEILLRMRGQRQFVAEAETATASITGIGTAAKKSSGAVVTGGGNMSRSGTAALARVGRQAKLLTLGLGVLGGVAFKTSADFQQSMNIWAAVAQGSNKWMNQARATAIRLGADIRLPGISAADVADTMLQLAKAGFTAKESIDAARGALLLAQAGNMNAADSTTILARTLRAFNMPASGAVKVVDALAAGELRTTATMKEIADGMTFVSASAHQMGVDMVDTTTALSILNDAGIAGTKAGTSLNQMFVRMANPTKKAIDALKSLRLWTSQNTSAFFDERGEFVGFRKATELLSTSLLGLTRQQKLQRLYAIFGREGQRAADRVLTRGTANWDSYRTAIGKAGQAQVYVNARLKGSKAAIESLRNAWQTFLIAFGATLAPALNPVLKGMGQFFSLLTKYPKVVAPVTAVIFGLAASLWALTTAAKVTKSLKEMEATFQLLAKASKIWAAAQWVLDASLWGFPVLLIVLALIALGVAVYEAYTRVGWFRNAVNATAAVLKVFALWLFRFFTKTLPLWIGYAVDFFRSHWMLIVAILTGPFGLAAYAIYRSFGLMKKWAGEAVAWIKHEFSSLIVFMQNLPKKLLKYVTGGVVGRALHIAGSIGSAVKSVIPGAAMGGIVTRPGLTLVGERGPELLSMPVGATVLPLDGGGAGGLASATIPVQVMLDRRVVGEAVAHWQSDQKARKR